MGNALRIKEVDFSENALGQVTYIEPVPCTGIVLSQSTLDFEFAEESKIVTATLTPSDTTDELSWTSTDANVASVENGTITIHGIGTATITATCGTQSASITISQTSLKAQYAIKIAAGCRPSKPNDYDIINIGTQSGQDAVGQSYHNVADLSVYRGSLNDIECIRVPYGATKVLFHTTDDNVVQISYGFVVSTTEQATFNDGINYAKYITRNTFVKSNVGMDVSYGQAVIFHATDAQIPTIDYFYFT